MTERGVVALSVVLPAFNEAGNIAATVQRAVAVLEPLGLSSEIIVVDDGSTDQTATIAAGLPVRLICHPDNLGYGAALRSGFAAARGERVFFTDADQQFDLSELPGLLLASSEADIAVGYRQVRRDPLHRRLNAAAWRVLVRRLLDVPVRDINCAFKIIHRRVLEQVTLSSTGALINAELLSQARAGGFSVVEIPVSHYPRITGQQTGARPAVILRALSELIALRGEARRRFHGSDRPEGSH
ncbi:MAG: glycosyltransferase family 2 protein [Myxococcota bacterium]|nr:glycosyltransferase family 2 protein [Myxococcota bacterium]